MAKRKQPPPVYPSEVDTSSSDGDGELFIAKSAAPAPQARNPKPAAPSPQARNPKPAAPSPQARNPKPPAPASQARNPKPAAPAPAEQEEDESESDSGTESEAEPEVPVKSTPAKKVAALPPSKKPEEEPEEEDSSSEEEDFSSEEEVEKVKSPVEKPADAEPEKKKAKLPELDQSPSKKSASAMSRIWTEDDEVVLLCALSKYHTKHGKLPPTKDYTSFLSTISGSISFPVTEKQLINKMRGLKNTYRKMVKKGPGFKFTRPHEKTVFELSSKLFQDAVNTTKKDEGHESSDDDDMENVGVGHANGALANGAMANGGPANSGSDNHDGGDASGSKSSNVYLRSLVQEMIAKQQFEGWLTTNDVISLIEESKVQSFEAKAKALRIEAVKLRAREDKLKSEVFGLVAKGMSNE